MLEYGRCEEYVFAVGGLPFALMAPRGLDICGMLPSYRDFAADAGDVGGLAFRMELVRHIDAGDCWKCIERTSADVGDVALSRGDGGYRIEVRPRNSRSVHAMEADAGFSHIRAAVDFSDRFASNALDAMLRTAYSMSVLSRKGISVHASCVVKDGKAYLFMGRSGTGKSTHSALWLNNIPGAVLLNDDNPVLRLDGSSVMACGTPWSGKTPCYKNEMYPVAGIVRLVQSGQNMFYPKYDVDAFSVILPGCAAIRRDGRIFGELCDTLGEISVRVPVGTMECRPDDAAAMMVYEHLEAMSAEATNMY